MADLHSIAHELYGLPLAEFIETRDAWAATERKGGDEQLAKDVRALRKPNATAWAVNLIARTVPDLLEELVDLGDQLRQAQASSDGARMRSLDQDRRRLMARVSDEAAAVAEQHDQSFSQSAASGVDETMKAALADPDAGRAVLDGMLVAGLSAPGLGSVDLSDTVAIDPARARKRPAPSKDTQSGDDSAATIAAARRAVTAAGRDANAAGKAAATARAKLDNAEEQSSDLERQVEDLTTQLEQLEERLAAARAKVEARQHEVETTSTAEAEALKALDEAEERVADLEG
jgi:valyl-tRNA synthetase